MSTPQGMLEGQSMTQPPYFNGQHYSRWKNHMENYTQADDYKLWMIIQNGPLILKKAIENGSLVPKKPEEFNTEDFKMMEKNTKAKKLSYFGLGPDEYSFCILALVLMSILVFLSASQPKIHGTPFK